MRKTILTVSLMLLVSVSVASADSVQYSTPFGPAATASAAFAVTLPQFDPSLGTLLSVTLLLDADTFSGAIAWDNEAGIASDVTLGIGAEVTATAPSALAAVAVPLQSGSASVAADEAADGTGDFLGADSFSIIGGSGNDSDSNVLLSGFGLYEGLGTFSTTISSAVETYVSTTGGYGPIDPVPGDFDGTVTVIYNYVPEPATMSLLGVGALALIRRKRK